MEWASKMVASISAGESVLIMEGSEKSACVPTLACLVQIMMDPFYRTIEGFTVLFCKEWMQQVYGGIFSS